jgi:hypothetical protein
VDNAAISTDPSRARSSLDTDALLHLAALLAGAVVRLAGSAVPTPWDPALQAALREQGRAVHEEAVLELLLADLTLPSTARRDGVPLLCRSGRSTRRPLLGGSRGPRAVTLGRTRPYRRGESATSLWAGHRTDVSTCDTESDTILPVAMTLRLDEQETEALRRRAELEGRSMQEVARQAVRDYIERTSKRELLDRVLDDGLPRYAEALERLGQ